MSYLLRMTGIDKRFTAAHALRGVDFDLREGEVHVLLGENGAGKSTLMKIILGVLQKDHGEIAVCGQTFDSLTPARAKRLGIGMVHQEFNLLPDLAVAENILLNRWPRNRFGLVDWKKTYTLARASLEQLGVSLDLGARTGRLDVSVQQLVEIARVFSADCRILLMDEPTSALSESEAERLFAAIRRLQARGVGIVYVSHRLNEVQAIGNRVTVLRDGRVVATVPASEAKREDLVQWIVGKALAKEMERPALGLESGVLLEVKELRAPPAVSGVSFELRRGEILGIFGLVGAGQTELARALFALDPGRVESVRIAGKKVILRRPQDAIAHGLAYLTRDRRKEVVPLLSITPNLMLVRTGRSPLWSALQRSGEQKESRHHIAELNIKPASLTLPLRYFSGGNQQKVLLARWLSARAKVLMLDEPTRGIDIGAKAEIYALLRRLASDGLGVVVISSDITEILSIADRILVMRSGSLVAAFRRHEASQENLLHAAG
jgi:ribose transport system ATP-binding protein